MPAVRGTTRVLAVLGWPVRHSLSPPMQNAALEALGLDYVYVPLEVAPDDLPAAVAGLRAAGLVGFNATIPHKEALVSLVDQLTPAAERTGSVNTVHFTPAGSLGDSTDGPGFIAAAEAAGCPVAGRRVVLLGAGGSARAVGAALLEAGAARLVVANRTASRAADLAARLNGVGAGPASAMALDEPRLVGELSSAELIVNTTSAGMHPREEERPLELPALQPGSWLVDIIYTPSRTRLMEDAAERGAKTLGGLDMLVHQGALSLRRWTGCEPPLAVMREVLVAELQHRRRAG